MIASLLLGALGWYGAQRSQFLKETRDARRERIKKGGEESHALRVAELEAQGAFRDDLLAREAMHLEENRQLRGKIDNMRDTLQAQGEEIVLMRTALAGFADDVADIRSRREAGEVNGDMIRRLTRLEQQLRETSPRFGAAGGGR